MDYLDRFTRDPEICAGETVTRGTRVTLRTVLASLAEGDSQAHPVLGGLHHEYCLVAKVA